MIRNTVKKRHLFKNEENQKDSCNVIIVHGACGKVFVVLVVAVLGAFVVNRSDSDGSNKALVV